MFVLLTLIYPFVVFWALTHWGVQTSGLVLLAWMALGVWAVLKQRQSKTWLPWALSAALIGMGIVLRQTRLFLFTPVVINLGLLFLFAHSLREPQPILERFARKFVSDLSPVEVRYCRSVTKVWCLFFMLNATAAAGLAVFGTLQSWVFYNGFLAYVLMGILMTTEYVVRKIRFRRYGNRFYDRWLAGYFPPYKSL